MKEGVLLDDGEWKMLDEFAERFGLEKLRP
jgi:hypothetical protein